MLCNGSMTACGAVGVSSILTFRFRDVKSDERSEFDYFNSQEFKLPQRFALRRLTFRFRNKEGEKYTLQLFKLVKVLSVRSIASKHDNVGVPDTLSNVARITFRNENNSKIVNKLNIIKKKK